MQTALVKPASGRAEAAPVLAAPVNADMQALLADPDVSEEARKSGVDVAAWTVNKPEFRQKLERLGVHRFITDEPERLRDSQ